MTKKELKTLLITLKIENPENEAKINKMLEHLSKLNEKEFEEQFGNYSEEDIKKEIFRRLQEPKRQEDKFKKIDKNDYFTYGVNGDCVNIHVPPFPEEFKAMFRSKNLLVKTKAFTKLAISFFDALEKIKQQKDNGNSEFKDTKKIYMISPIFGSPTFNHFRVLRLLKLLGFKTQYFCIEQLGNEDFVAQNKEAKLGVEKFGTKKNLGSATITYEKMNTDRWKNNIRRLKKLLEKINTKKNNHNMER